MQHKTVRVLVVTDVGFAAFGMLLLMPLSWERDGSTLKRYGLRVEWEIDKDGLSRFNVPGCNANTPYSAIVHRGSLLLSKGTILDGRVRLRLDGESRGIRLIQGASRYEFDVHIRLMAAEEFAAPRIDAGTFARLFTAPGPDGSIPTDFVLLGVTDANLQVKDRDIGSGVDQILNPGLLGKVIEQLPAVPRIAIAMTGLERDFVRFDVADPRWSAFGSAHGAAWNPRLIQSMLREIVLNRPHLVNLMLNDARFRASPARPIAVTAVMPCGFLRDWNCINYNPWDEPEGWLEGSPAIRSEKDAPYVVPYCCADPLLTALTGLTTDFQITPNRLRSRPGQPPRVGIARAGL